MHFEASADIQAPADAIWSILTDAPAYPSWGSGVTRVEGRITEGAKIKQVHSEVATSRAFPVKVAMRPPRRDDLDRWHAARPLHRRSDVPAFAERRLHAG